MKISLAEANMKKVIKFELVLEIDTDENPELDVDPRALALVVHHQRRSIAKQLAKQAKGLISDMITSHPRSRKERAESLSEWLTLYGEMGAEHEKSYLDGLRKLATGMTSKELEQVQKDNPMWPDELRL